MSQVFAPREQNLFDVELHCYADIRSIEVQAGRARLLGLLLSGARLARFILPVVENSLVDKVKIVHEPLFAALTLPPLYLFWVNLWIVVLTAPGSVDRV